MDDSLKRRLDERLVNGEITNEEYRDLLKTLGASAPPKAQKPPRPTLAGSATVPTKVSTNTGTEGDIGTKIAIWAAFLAGTAILWTIVFGTFGLATPVAIVGTLWLGRVLFGMWPKSDG